MVALDEIHNVYYAMVIMEAPNVEDMGTRTEIAPQAFEDPTEARDWCTAVVNRQEYIEQEIAQAFEATP